jgi:cytochrome c-type biogenesis protein CcmH
VSGDLIFWIGAGVLTALAVMALLRPLLSARARDAASEPGATATDAAAPRAAYDLAVYRDQLAEIGRDQARGVLNQAEAEAARTEVERRILASADAPAAPAPHRSAPRAVAVAVAVVLPVLALGLYAGLGAPGLPGAPADGRHAALDAALAGGGVRGDQAGVDGPDMVALVDQLAERMKERPDDVRGWLLLARSYGTLGRYQDSADAYAAALARGAGDGDQGAEAHAAYGEALTAAANGQITVAAKAAFDAALARDPAEPRARFYLALAKAQGGDVEAALADWVRLEAEAPADAPWRVAVTDQIERAAAALGRDPAGRPGRVPPAPPESMPAGPDESDMAAAAEMTPEERDAFIRGMVDRLATRLAAAPEDLDGWLRLGRAYGVLGEADNAQAAWARAAALAPARADIQLGYAQAVREASVEDAPLPPEFAQAVAKARALEPDNPLGLYLGGLAESATGNPAGARALWERLRGLLPEGSPERAEIEALLAALPAG